MTSPICGNPECGRPTPDYCQCPREAHQEPAPATPPNWPDASTSRTMTREERRAFDASAWSDLEPLEFVDGARGSGETTPPTRRALAARIMIEVAAELDLATSDPRFPACITIVADELLDAGIERAAESESRASQLREIVASLLESCDGQPDTVVACELAEFRPALRRALSGEPR